MWVHLFAGAAGSAGLGFSVTVAGKRYGKGSIVGAAFVGGASAALPWAIKPVVADVLVFLIAIAIVKFRPEGLLSLRRK